jgi:hypothetical protein
MENKILKAMTLSEIVAMTLVTGFIVYRTYQIVKDPHTYRSNIEQTNTNSTYYINGRLK